MQPDELYDTFAEIALDNLRDLQQEFERGVISTATEVCGYLAFFRQVGVCRLLADGTADALFLSQQQAASGYLFRLPSLDPEDLSTSMAGVFWDAVGGQYWDAAQAIAQASRPTWNPKREYEEDFLFVWFLMSRYFLGASPDEQQALLTRWEQVIQDALSPQLDLCRALVAQTPKDVIDALVRLTEERAEDVARDIDKGVLAYDAAAWIRPYWNQGLALVRLLERDQFVVPPMLLQVPDVVRTPCTYPYNPAAWRAPR